MMNQPRLDFTQYSTFLECPYLWYEKYVKGLERIRDTGRVNNSRVIGSLVHKGLERFFKTGDLILEQLDAEELDAAPEALYTARTLLEGYIQNYSGEELLKNTIHTEEPLQFTSTIGYWEVPCVAKVDSYTLLPEATEIRDAQQSHYCEPGYWIIEHKTKSSELNRAKYAQAWIANVQADFQIMALESVVRAPVQGLIVNVLEKPRNSAPRRKCRGCGQYSEYSSWLPAEDLKHSCPYCGATQKLSPLGPADSYAGDYYRIIVQTNLARREALQHSIQNVWGEMQDLRQCTTFAPYVATYNFRSCVHPIYGPCEFFEPHNTWTGAQEGPLYRIKEDPLQYIEKEQD